MAKKTRLLDVVRAERPVKSGQKLWNDVYRQSHPNEMEQIDELIDSFLAGELPGWTRNQIIQRIIAFCQPAGETTLERYVEQRREARNAKAIA